MSKKIAIFPGSFDPFTLGHEAVVRKALPLFDEMVIAIGENSSKNGYFTLEEKIRHIQAVYTRNPKISVQAYSGLTVDFCREIGATFIVRGLRDGKDFEYEKSIAIMNNKIYNDVETVFFMTDAEYSAINSVIVRDLLRHNGDPAQFLPSAIVEIIKQS
jgi:pantetheine-phosphate adenylyltransferase